MSTNEMRMRNTKLDLIFKIFLLAVIYVITGKIGLMLSLPPGYATIIWPPSGIALGFLIIYGRQVWPGIFLGAFFLNATVSGGISFDEGFNIQRMIIPIFIALGSSLQAIIGDFLLKKWIKFPVEIDRFKKILKVLLIALPIGCLISPTIGVSVLYLRDVIHFDQFFNNWFYWWKGDMLGVLIFLPLILLVSKDRSFMIWHGKSFRSLSGFSLLALAIPLGLTFYIWMISSQNSYEKSHHDFKLLVTESEKALLGRIKSYQYALLGGAGFFQGSDFVSRSEWRKYTKEIDIKNSFPGINGMGWIEDIKKNDLNRFLLETRKDQMNSFYIHPEVENEPFYIIKYIEPIEDNLEALGLNIGFEKNRRDAANHAIDTGRDTITKKINLVQDSEKTPGFLLLHPIYHKKITSLNVQERRQYFKGWVYAPFVAKKFLKDLTQSQTKFINIKVYDEGIEDESKLIYDSDLIEQAHHQPQYILKKELNIMEQKWLVVWSSTQYFEISQPRLNTTLVLAIGLLFSGLLMIFLVSSVVRKSQVKLISDEKKVFFIPFLSFLVGTLISVYLFNELNEREIDHVKKLVEEESRKVESLISIPTKEILLALERMGSRWTAANGTPYELWKKDAKNYVDHSIGLKTVEWVDSDYQIRWIIPLEGNEDLVGLDVDYDNDRNEILNEAKSKKIFITPPLDLVQGYEAFLVYVPIYQHKQFDGFIVGVLHIQDLFSEIIKNEISDNYLIKLKYQGKEFFSNTNDLSQDLMDWNFSKGLLFKNMNWSLEMTPTKKLVRDNLTSLPKIILISGLIIACLLFLTTRFIVISNDRLDQLKLIEERNRLIINGAQDYAIYMLDPEGNIQSWNSGAEKIKGYQESEIIGKNFSIFHLPNAIKNNEPQKVLKQAAINGKYEAEALRVRKNGQHFMAHIVLEPIYNSLQELIGYVNITHDITDRILQEAQLKELNFRLKLATDSAEIGVWEWDLKTNQLLWDENMFNLYGISVKDFKGNFIDWEKYIYADDLEKTKKLLNNAIANKKRFNAIFRAVWPDQSIHYIKATGDIVSNKKGKPVKVVGVNWDITDEIKVQTIKNEFISTVSHEIRTPLTSISVSLGIINDEKKYDLPSDVKMMVSMASESCEHLTNLINDILDIEKIESGKMSFNPKPCSIDELLRKSIEANRSYAEDLCGVKLELESSVIEAKVNVDKEKFYQIMNNLISNAAKFSPPYQRVIIRAEKENERIKISVQDFGLGIPEEHRKNIFQKFFQVDSSNTRKRGGTGLGLSIVKSIVEKHGGKIDFITQTGNYSGTTFYFDLEISES